MLELSTIVGVHLHEQTVIEHRVHAEDDRVIVEFRPPTETYRACRVTVYADRMELVRLRDAVTDALIDLTAARQAWEEEQQQGSPGTAA